MRRIAQLAIVGVAGVVGAVVCVFAYFYWISGPDITISPTKESIGIEIDTRFLGEYHLGLNRLTISTAQGSTIAELRSEHAEIPSLFRLVPGSNHLKPFSQGTASAALEPFTLNPGVAYSIEVCGNNGFGHIRCSSAEFSL